MSPHDRDDPNDTGMTAVELEHRGDPNDYADAHAELLPSYAELLAEIAALRVELEHTREALRSAALVAIEAERRAAGK